MSAVEMQVHLQELRVERALAALEGLASTAVYMAGRRSAERDPNAFGDHA